MPPTHPQSPAQQRVIALLSAGSTATAAAQFVGVHRNTVGNWLRSSAFRDALTETRRDQDLAWREQTRSLAGQALGAIQAVLADPQAPAAVRLDAALAVQGRTCAKSPAQPHTKPAIPQPVGRPSRNQPCPCGSGRKFKRCRMSVR
jgi:preprotein translocase subunit SecA